MEGPGLAVTLNQLAHVCMRADRDEEALEHLSRSLRIRRESLGEDHPQVATALHGIANMHAKMERYDEADAALQTAWFITDRSLGADETHVGP